MKFGQSLNRILHVFACKVGVRKMHIRTYSECLKFRLCTSMDFKHSITVQFPNPNFGLDSKLTKVRISFQTFTVCTRV